MPNLSFKDIKEKLKNVTPFQSKLVAESYIGQPISWRLKFCDIKKNPFSNLYYVIASDISDDSVFSNSNVGFDVDLGIFPKFQIIEKGMLFDINAKLESVSEYSIHLHEITDICFISSLDILKNNDVKNGNSIIKENINNTNHGTQIINIGNENKNIIKNTIVDSKDKKFSMENPIVYTVFSLILAFIIYYFGIK